jgi:hypothetical protein
MNFAADQKDSHGTNAAFLEPLKWGECNLESQLRARECSVRSAKRPYSCRRQLVIR